MNRRFSHEPSTVVPGMGERIAITVFPITTGLKGWHA